MADLLITGGSVVTADGPLTADVAIGDGRITAVGPDLPADAVDRIDARGLLVLPGAVDVHTHVRLPSTDAPDRFFRDSLAAGLGGTTTFLSFNNPGTGISQDGQRSLLRGMAEFRERTAGESAIDFALSAVITGQQDDPVAELPALIAAGVPTFKAFMVYDFRLPDAELEQALRVAARHGGMLQVHCEDPAIIDPLVSHAVAAGKVGCRHHALCRPAEAEARATWHAIELARRAEAPLYIVHLSCEAALDAVADAKARGEPVYAETCPHYLTFDASAYDDPDEAEVIKRVISPPLRTRHDIDALWSGLRDGVLDTVGSDHVPDRVAVEKHVPAPPFPEISNGGPGIETLLSVVYSRGVAEGRLSLGRFVDVVATTPARRFGLPSKGAVEVGRDADLVLFDPAASHVVHQAELHHTSDYTPYEGMPVVGAVRSVLLRGAPIGERRGRFLERSLPAR
ncbi:MAG TPA: dihydropyrimidinase [Candidatus Limnocylindria bacterium]|nr:dihydropyrimidinase [Candidatus Limnocylindria bacterium]